jgi:hypothetical protein
LNALNLAADVMIIKELLNKALKDKPKFAATGLTPFVVDGSETGVGDAIKKYQMIVLGWSSQRSDGRVDPNGGTWRSLNGNVESAAAISLGSFGGYTCFRQGAFDMKLGNSTTETFAASGCAVTSLSMAATLLGHRTTHWPADIEPKDLTPPIVQTILRAAGAFQGAGVIFDKAIPALGMTLKAGYGRFAETLDGSEIVHIDVHLLSGKPVILHVDWSGGSGGDHFILCVSMNGDDTYNILDPATGGKMLMTSARQGVYTVNARSLEKDRETGVLWGVKGMGNSANQTKYICTAFLLVE